ncbi:molybdenum cofactor synthesis protein [Myxococcota bacterium]|nr:molybdenum cofactor synthesis protein [Myxococcota bacterium]MBU1533863.1 molybdenum cofactor synthesis protein [Myxococcota bacterium]
MDFTLKAINISEKKGVVKHPVERATIDLLGIVDDAHRGEWHRQVSLLSAESVAGFKERSGYDVKEGEFAENLLISGIDFTRIHKLDRFRIGDVELEVTQIGKVCHGDSCAIYRAVGECIMPREGVFARVIKGGIIRPGDHGEYTPRVLSVRVVTLSDRAARGVYADKSGPLLVALLEKYLGPRTGFEVLREVIPDDALQLKERLLLFREQGVDLVFTTGGTGLGPRDVTPEVVREVADKEIPGIMESIRVKFGTTIPSAVLSRSIAALSGTTLIFALPGSVKAVGEYFGEIEKILLHLVEMVNGLGH